MPNRPAAAPTPSIVAVTLGLLIPGLGHLWMRRWRAGLLFISPIVVIAGLTVVNYAQGGIFRFLAFAVTPGVLGALAISNVLLAVWRLVALVELLRAKRPGAPSLAAISLAAVFLIGAPHIVLGNTIATVDELIKQTFAGSPTPSPSESAVSTASPETSAQPSDSASSDPSGTPTGGNTGARRGTLPELGAATPWTMPSTTTPWGATASEDPTKFDLLLIGSDGSPTRTGRRTDVMMLVEMDVVSGKVLMVSIPRNLTNVPLPPGTARDLKPCKCVRGMLNGLYSTAMSMPDRWPGEGPIRGIGAVRGAIEELTDRPIDAVLVADLFGVVKVIDALGGIDINIPETIVDKHYPAPEGGHIRVTFAKGNQHYNGHMALAYARTRHSDSDYGRMRRQFAVLLAVREKITVETILNAADLVRAAKGFAWTDISQAALPALIEQLGPALTGQAKQFRIMPPRYTSPLTRATINAIRERIKELMP
jgi:LCP family protein required for cell wall assembly